MSFARSLATVSGLTVVSRLAGFVRDTLTATLLGAGPEADAFFVAQRLPNLFRSLFAEGAFTAAFVPLYTSETAKNGEEAAQRFAGQAMALLLTFLTLFSILIIAAMPWVIQILAPGFQDDPAKYATTIAFSRITFPYLMLISLTALQTGVLNAHGRFGPGAAAPIALNLVLIAALFLAPLFHWRVGLALSWATTISGVVQATWLAVSCARARVSIPLLWPHMTEATRRLFRQIGPGAVGAGAAQINLLLSTILASLLPTGAVSFLFYADRLNQLPLGIVGIAVATTLLPILSRASATGDAKAALHTTSRAIEFCLALGLPATLGLSLAATPIIQTLFEHGAFTHADTLATAHALTAYAMGVPAFLLVKVFTARFFARHDTKTPVKYALAAMVTNVLVALLLLGPMAHVGMALATSVATWVNALLLYRRLRSLKEDIADDELKRRLPRLGLCAAGMGLATWGGTHLFGFLFETSVLAREVLGLATIIGLSCLVYGALLLATRTLPLEDIKRLLGLKKLV